MSPISIQIEIGAELEGELDKVETSSVGEEQSLYPIEGSLNPVSEIRCWLDQENHQYKDKKQTHQPEENHQYKDKKQKMERT